MRAVENVQMRLGEVDISQIQFDLRSRDDIPRVLRGLQYIYTHPILREKIFEILRQKIAPNISQENGRPGMLLWRILVCGILRLDLNIDYDRLLELMNQHLTLREMLGHDRWDRESKYMLKTVKRNVALLTPEILDEISQLLVREGHALIKKDGNGALRGRCDSFVVETHVHFPTDINLLFDATRKVIELTAQLCEKHKMSGWRQSAHLIRELKRAMRYAQSSKRSRKKSEETQEESAEKIKHREYVQLTQKYLSKARDSLMILTLECGLSAIESVTIVAEIKGFMKHADRQIDQIERRVLKGETIPHEEKVFSLFQPHTEWISKGKAGVPVELGIRVCVLEDHHGFILHHHVMQKQTDEVVATLMVREAQKRFTGLSVCSFDRGFHSPQNQIELAQMLEHVGLPRKGKLSQKAREHENSAGFRAARHKHAAVESAINGLEVHGLDVCPDHGITGFKRYVAFAVLARNIHRLGDIVWKRDIQRAKRAQIRAEKKRCAQNLARAA